MQIVTLACDMETAHVDALQRLIERLDYDRLSAWSGSAQQTYDMIIALERLRAAIDGVRVGTETC